LQAAHAQVAAARAAFFPRIALTGSFGTASAQLDGLFDSGSKAWTFAPSISLPILDGGRRRANLDLATVRQHSAVASYERSVQTAFREVADALSARHFLAQQLRVQQDNLQVLQERNRLAQLRYDNGASPYLDVLDAQRELLGAAQQAVQVAYALQAAQVSLYTALGGAPTDTDRQRPSAVTP
jgi:multidrug efflux system outer membrane protein